VPHSISQHSNLPWSCTCSTREVCDRVKNQMRIEPKQCEHSWFQTSIERWNADGAFLKTDSQNNLNFTTIVLDLSSKPALISFTPLKRCKQRFLVVLNNCNMLMQMTGTTNFECLIWNCFYGLILVGAFDVNPNWIFDMQWQFRKCWMLIYMIYS
jgi:hypothetical protein